MPTNRTLLLEGPVGHMAHPYENFSLTFNNLKEMFSAAVNGFPDIEVTEKLDGQNLIVSYDHDSGKALGIRRMKEHSETGGIDKEAMRKFFTQDKVDKALSLAKKRHIKTGESEEEATRLAGEELEGYEGIKHVADAFYDAMQNFEEAAAVLPREFFVTDEGCRIFYNSEVIDPRSRNIIDYDTQQLVLHRSNHSKLCNGILQPLEKSEEHASFVEKTLSMMQSEDSDEVPKVLVNQIMKFDNLIVDQEILHITNLEIDTLLSSESLNPNNTIGDFFRKKVGDMLEEEWQQDNTASVDDEGFTDKIKEVVVDAVLFYTKTATLPRINTEVAAAINMATGERNKRLIRAILRDKTVLSYIAKSAIKPIEIVVHKFASKFLEAVHSLYVISSDDTVKSHKSKISHKIRSLTDFKGDKEQEKAMATLHKNVQKILSDDTLDLEKMFSDEVLMNIIDQINFSMEGLAFIYDGQLYKFTGQFAPINQIMGLGRFSRGAGHRKINEEAEARANNIAVFSGGFKPPHVGHYMGAKYLAQKVGARKLIVLVGHGERTDSIDGSIKINAADSVMVWDTYLSTDPSVDFEYEVLNPGLSPVRWAYEALENNFFPIGSTIAVGIGASVDNPGEPEDSRWAALHKFKNYKTKIVVIPLQGAGIRGKIMRDMLANDDDRINHYLPDHLSDEQKLDLRANLSGNNYIK